jgi:L-lactate dehydrogenase (cytochrome)
MIPASYPDYRELARRRLPNVLFSYIDGGAGDETTLRRNSAAFSEIALEQRVMRPVEQVDLSTTLFGDSLAMPLILAPIGMGGMVRRRGETQAIRAAASAGIPITLSTLSVCAIDEVRRAADRPMWFQLYMIRDRGYMASVLERAAAAGTTVLVFTVDFPVPGIRYRDIRSGLSGKPTPFGGIRRALDGLSHPAWMHDVWLNGRPHHYGNLVDALPNASGSQDFAGWIRNNIDSSLTWADLAWVRERWKGAIVIKGVLNAEDARECVNIGAEGLIVSNHGGRQLDGAPASIEALPAIAEAVGDKLTVLMDGGVRSGTDVVRAMALGAKGCLIGRPWVYALAARGEEGLKDVLAAYAQEIRTALALTGCNSVHEVGPQVLAKR